jgi:4-hydroxy-2-oxoheptanedioate aldolase
MIGIFSKTTDSSFVEAAGIAGLDFIILDQEHGPISRDKLYDHVRAAKVTGMKSIVRVSELNHNSIGAALDSGADGVQIPNISNATEAKLAIKAARFHPIGMRGVCRFVKDADFGKKDKLEYFDDANKKTLILQVEGVEGISNIEEILSLEGFDILFIGPYDLSQALGVPGQVDHPKVLKVMKDVVLKAQRSNKKLGTFTDNVNMLHLVRDIGFDFIAHSVDVNIFLNACSNIKNLNDE